MGKYCALSRCWGAAEKRPSMTMRHNLTAHLSGISFSSLTKTFREALILTQALGFDYLQIDSLCIVQDDTDYWEAQSKEMGTQYAKAVLVIAAAYSSDCTRGLFIAERPSSGPACFPCFTNGSVEQSLNITPAPYHEIWYTPARSPLRKRAWAFQGWYLARRRLFFTPSGMIWSCQTIGLDEQDYHPWTGLTDHRSYDYSTTDLTYPSDRLIAIQGVTNEIRKRKEDQFVYGAWKSEIVSHLLWKMDCPNQQQNVPDLPSRCWASIRGFKTLAVSNMYRDNKSDSSRHQHCRLRYFESSCGNR
ncbi:hypothetical protein BCR34DRAFT_500046 [Clohesyomyces aquaticus]|uniref:Heterokaryon incompatibility domain-containing protein n=1 Tax=Clohesyomyces aquaticus TaxID=1231657 RepID=A0A1Y1Y6L6_9PLEO|nr:hypothetical protein BCR34DRAFT_500046 [Clohesyomyces aquaticus]